MSRTFPVSSEYLQVHSQTKVILITTNPLLFQRLILIIVWIAMTFWTNIHGSRRMNLSDLILWSFDLSSSTTIRPDTCWMNDIYQPQLCVNMQMLA